LIASMMTNACAHGWSSVSVRWICALWPAGNHLREPFGGAAGQRQRRRARRGVDDADVLHEHAALESRADGFRKGLLRGEALGIGAGTRERAPRRLGALDIGEDAIFEALAEAVERVLDALYIAEVGAEADDHDACPSRPDTGPRRPAVGFKLRLP
jgi:hypothetical protein